ESPTASRMEMGIEMKKRMKPTAANFRQHVEQLADAFGITVIYDKALPRHEAAAMKLRPQSIPIIDQLMGLTDTIVHAPPIDDETSYAVVMHEMGHHLAPDGHCTHPVPKPGCHPRDRHSYMAAKLHAEHAAWEWAKYYVEQVFVWTTAMEHVRQYA